MEKIYTILFILSFFLSLEMAFATDIEVIQRKKEQKLPLNITILAMVEDSELKYFLKYISLEASIYKKATYYAIDGIYTVMLPSLILSLSKYKDDIILNLA